MINYTLLEFDTLNSTSNFLRENHPYFPHMTIIRVNHQTEGRGQFERKWESKPNQNLLFSILLKDVNVSKSYEIKSWIKTSLMNYLFKQGIDVTFKEPNDLYVLDKKICGILIETQTQTANFDYVIIGIGLNINQEVFEVPNATSLSLETRRTYDLQDIFKQLLAELMVEYDKFGL